MDEVVKEILAVVFTDGLGKIRETVNKEVEEIDVTLGLLLQNIHFSYLIAKTQSLKTLLLHQKLLMEFFLDI